jgi:hypothetical protein
MVVNDPEISISSTASGMDVKGSQPLHQLIPMATRSSTRHKLTRFSPQLVEVVLQNLLGIPGAPAGRCLSLAPLHSQRSGSLENVATAARLCQCILVTNIITLVHDRRPRSAAGLSGRDWVHLDRTPIRKKPTAAFRCRSSVFGSAAAPQRTRLGSAQAGSAIGAVASFATTWLTQHA